MPDVTHFCDWDAVGRRVVGAICGATMRRRDHVNDPTCSACQRVLAERAADYARSCPECGKDVIAGTLCDDCKVRKAFARWPR